MQHAWFDIYTAYLLGKFGPKIQNCQFKVKFGIVNSSDMQDSMVIFNFSVFQRKYPFWATLIRKIKNVSLS